MSLETRSSAHFKRAEQLRRWEDSETNREPTVPKVRSSKVKFPSSCVFLAACTAGDKDEVLKLLEKGIDINTPNVDGLTALHQVSRSRYDDLLNLTCILPHISNFLCIYSVAKLLSEPFLRNSTLLFNLLFI